MIWARRSTCGRCFRALRPIGWPGSTYRYRPRSSLNIGRVRSTPSSTSPTGQSPSGLALSRSQTRSASPRGFSAASERLVNELSARARRDTLRTAKDEVGRAERRLKSALTRLRDFRDREGIIDPRKTADATSALAGRVRDELVRADTELSTLKHYMREDAPSVKMLEARIQSLEAQRRSVESEVTDKEKTRSEALSRVMGSYEQLEAERTFAENAYQHALQALDSSRMNADRQQVYLASFVRPTLPEKALYPRRLLSLTVVFVSAFVVWGIGGLMFRSVRDHLRP